VTDADPRVTAARAAERIHALTGVDRHAVVVVLGSGWGPAADAFGPARVEVAMTDVPGFVAPTAEGHRGTIASYDVSGVPVLVLAGRTHLYEGLGLRPVVHGIRTAAAAGCSVALLTNANGSLRADLELGQAVLVRDHLNLTGTSPIEGAHFVDLTDLYSPRLRTLCREVEPDLDEGVYVQLPGPHYETPAEIGMVRAIGGHLVGMSTALEAIAAREAGLEVLGISLVTNLAAGITGQPLNHEEVLQAGRAAASRMGDLLGAVVPRL
jgi:purine-nucleoside phosphorylase